MRKHYGMEEEQRRLRVIWYVCQGEGRTELRHARDRRNQRENTFLWEVESKKAMVKLSEKDNQIIDFRVVCDGIWRLRGCTWKSNCGSTYTRTLLKYVQRRSSFDFFCEKNRQRGVADGNCREKLFGLLCTAHWLRPRNPPPPHLGSYKRALLVSQDRRHLFVTPGSWSLAECKDKARQNFCVWHVEGDTNLGRGKE